MNQNRQYFGQNEEEIEIMPIVPLTEDEMSDDEKKALPKDLIVLPLRNMVLYPNVVIPITVSREKSIKALQEAEKTGKHIGVISQTDAKSENPGYADINKIGTVAQIIRQIKMPDGSLTVFMRGRLRFKVNEWLQDEPFFKADVTYLEDTIPAMDNEFAAMIATVRDMAEQIMRKSSNVPPEASIVLKNIENISFLNHFIASNLNCDTKDKQALLEENNFTKRTEDLLRLLQVELQHVELKNKISDKTRGELDKQQRDYFLNQQMKAIKDELGGDSNDREVKDLQKRAEGKNGVKQQKKCLQKELKSLSVCTHLHLIIQPFITISTYYSIFHGKNIQKIFMILKRQEKY